MIRNSATVESILNTHGKGKRAQVGYDLTVSEIKKVVGGSVYTHNTVVANYIPVYAYTYYRNNKPTDMWVLHEGVYSITFDQGCKIPADKTALIWPRSSIVRIGGDIKSGVYDPGFEVDNMGAILYIRGTVEIEKGARVAQLIMFDSEPGEMYNGQWNRERDIK